MGDALPNIAIVGEFERGHQTGMPRAGKSAALYADKSHLCNDGVHYYSGLSAKQRHIDSRWFMPCKSRLCAISLKIKGI
jgi:hypothetical protein